MTGKRFALATGTNRGIGKEIARQQIGDPGLLVIVSSREQGKGQATVQQVGYDTEDLQLDVSDQNSVTAAFR